MGIYVLVYYLVLRRIATPAFGALVLVASLVALCVGYYGLAWLMQGGGRPFFFVVWCAVGILLAPVMSYLVHCSTMLERKSGLAAGFIAGIFVGEILVGSFFFGDPTNNILMFAIDVLGVLVVLRLAKATRINLFHTVCGVVIATSLYLGGIELLRLVTGTIRP